MMMMVVMATVVVASKMVLVFPFPAFGNSAELPRRQRLRPGERPRDADAAAGLRPRLQLARLRPGAPAVHLGVEKPAAVAPHVAREGEAPASFHRARPGAERLALRAPLGLAIRWGDDRGFVAVLRAGGAEAASKRRRRHQSQDDEDQRRRRHAAALVVVVVVVLVLMLRLLLRRRHAAALVVVVMVVLVLMLRLLLLEALKPLFQPVDGRRGRGQGRPHVDRRARGRR